MKYLALLTCIAFVVYLFRLERKRGEEPSGALWIPLIWMFFAGSRFLSHWLSMGGAIGLDNIGDGSPLDRTVFLGLMVAAVVVLRRRNVNWRTVFFDNKLIWLYFVFGAASVVWSVYPGISLRRLIKALGNVAMALVILTDEKPNEAIGTVLRRLAYLTLPMSVVFIKWFPELGRDYHANGVPMFTGIGMQKNSLGQLCLLAGIYCIWRLLYKPEKRLLFSVRPAIPMEWLILAFVAYLMSMADSATSMGCLLAAAGVLVLGKLPLSNTPTRLVIITVAISLTVSVLDETFDITGTAIEALGRERDLTTRIPMWTDLLERDMYPTFGPGFEVYWLTDQGILSLDRWFVGHAHNGYLETYLSLGIVGLVIQVVGILSALPKIARHSKFDMSGAVLRLSLIVILVFYNWTEATLRSVSNTWLLFFVAGFGAAAIRCQENRDSLRAARPISTFFPRASGPAGHATRNLARPGREQTTTPMTRSSSSSVQPAPRTGYRQSFHPQGDADR